MKINFRMLWPLLGVLSFAALSLIAFEAIGFVTEDTVQTGFFHVEKLSDLTNSEGKMFDIYCLAVSGLVVSWAAVILPLIGFFFGKMPRFNAALGGLGFFFEIAGAALMLTALSLFITSTGTLIIDADKPDNVFVNVKDNYDKGLIAANYVLVALGLGVSLAGTGSGFFRIKPKKNSK